MKGIDLLNHYLGNNKNIISAFIINTCKAKGFLPISPECNKYFHSEMIGIMNACSFFEGSFLWSNTSEGNDYWFNQLYPIMMEIKTNGLPIILTLKPNHKIKQYKFE